MSYARQNNMETSPSDFALEHEPAPEQLEMWSVGPSREQRGQPARCALAIGSACLATAMPIGRKILLRDAPPILWRKLQEDLANRLSQLTPK